MSALKRPPPAAALSTYMHELYAKGASFDASVRLFLLHTQPGQPNL